jgi:chromosome segregation ATPase
MKKPDFAIPSLADSSPEYAELLAKRASLSARQSELSAEKRRLEKEIRTAPQKEYSARVAALLGEPEDETEHTPRRRVREIGTEFADIESALSVLADRIRSAKSSASGKVRAAAKPEYARRVQAMAKAIEALKDARDEYVALIDDFVANDVEWTALVPLQPNFCGDRHDGNLERWLRAAREAGYVA